MSHEILPLELLRLVNKGSPQASDNQVQLWRMPINSSITLQVLASDWSGYANPSVCVEDDWFVIHFGKFVQLLVINIHAHSFTVVCQHPLSGLASFDGCSGHHT